jgi:hypothetical protein
MTETPNVNDQDNRQEFTIAQIARLKNRPPKTIGRWASRGVLVNGRTVKLGSRRLGGQRFVTLADWDRFAAACNGDAQAATETAPICPSREARIAAAERELASA